MESQYELNQKIVNLTGLNLVTCGNCGSIVIHKVTDKKITCPYCNLTSELCDFPDLFNK